MSNANTNNAVDAQADAGGETLVQEGAASLFFPSQSGVFYNPPQIPNRDLSVLCLQQFTEDFRQETSERRAAGVARREAREQEENATAAAASAAALPGEEADSAEAKASGDAGGGAAPCALSSETEKREGAAESVVPEDTAVEEDDVADEGDGGNGGDGNVGKDKDDAVKVRVIDALSASGLCERTKFKSRQIESLSRRAMRYALEVPGLDQIVANDLDPSAVEVMKANFERNGLSEPLVVSHVGDASAMLHSAKRPASSRFEVVDLDPYGSAAPFLDAGVQAVAEGGMLMVTCTDLAVLCGAYPEACAAKYGSFPIKRKYCHESALRVLLACIDTHANRYGRYITPLLSVYINFYVRVFVRVHTSKSMVKLSPTKRAYLYQCSGCDAFAFQPVARVTRQDTKGNPKVSASTGPPVGEACAHCGRVHHIGGPLWTAPIHDDAFVRRVLRRLHKSEEAFSSHKQLIGLLTLVLEEVRDAPLFTNLSALASTLRAQSPALVAVFSALMRQGYRVSRSHTDPLAIKTDAPFANIFDVMRTWIKQVNAASSKSHNNLSETSPGYAIMQKEPQTEIQRLLSKKGHDGMKLTKFVPTPAQWGPGSRGHTHAALVVDNAAAASAGAEFNDGKAETRQASHELGGQTTQSQRDKRERNQGKRARKRQLAEVEHSEDA